jgi:hypothetical protein
MFHDANPSLHDLWGDLFNAGTGSATLTGATAAGKAKPK